MQRVQTVGNPSYKYLYTLMVCLACLCTLPTKAISQPGESLTLKANNIALFEVFREIYKQTKFTVSYSNTIINDKEKVNVNFSATPIQEVMSLLFKGKNVNFVFNENLIVIRKNEDRQSTTDTLINIIPSISGKVSDSEGRPIPGASVMVKGTQNGTTTGTDGNFVLSNVKRDGTLIITSIGFETRELVIRGSSILVELNVVVSELDETVIIGYGTTTQRFSTGNVSSVKAKDIEKQPVSNPLLSMQGRVPGLFITQNTGVPGGGITVRIQGQNSLNRGNDPLYVIDGVPYISQMLPNLSGTLGILGENGNTSPTEGGGGNPLSFLNPADIQSIEILKDADATSIYGSRAAAGAILITTKKGQSGKTKVNINVQHGWGKITNHLELLNSKQYLEMRHEAKMNDNAVILATDYDLNGTWDTTQYTDWQNVLIGGTAKYTDAQASISGGNSNTQFLLNSAYHRETTVFPGDLSDEKAMFHVNINHASPNQKLKLQFSGNYTVDDNRLINTDLTSAAIRLAPVAPSLYNADGTLNWAPRSNGNSSWYNPLAYLNGYYNLNVKNLIGNVTLSYHVLPGLDIKSSFGYTNMQTDEVSTFPSSTRAPELRNSTSRRAFFGNGTIQSFIIEPQITYKRRISNGVFEALIGSTFQENKTDLVQYNATGFNSDLVVKDIRSASSITVDRNVESKYRYNALFARINYNWMGKYILNLTGRRDGSSRFGSQNLLHNFGSVGAAWIFSNEPFGQQVNPILTFGKLRGSYGTTGNDQIGEYQFMSLYDPINFPANYQQATGLAPTSLPNPYLQWEETKKLQLGLDLAFLKERVSIYTTYYHNRSSNQLQSYALPFVAGFNNIQLNFPAIVQNTGWEFTVNTRNFEGKSFSWNTSANLTIPNNKLIAYPDLSESTFANLYVVGEPLPISRSFNFIGVDPQTGIFLFKNSKGEVTPNPTEPDDQTLLNIASPTFFGGIQNNFRFKGFELDFLFQFVKQKGSNYKLGTSPGRFQSTNTGSRIANQPVTVLDRWQKPGDEAFFQKFSSQYPEETILPYIYATVSNLTFSDASYIRLKNLSMSWQIPENWKKSMHLQQAKFYLQGQNLLTITNYIGTDPETKSVRNLPPLKLWTLGLQITF